MKNSSLAISDIKNPDPDEAQRRAADPNYSVWVGASAGSGKTKVLTDRLLRLLLPSEDGRPGTRPEAILCLTFTKAAAQEMALRLNKKLGAWAVMDDAALAADMGKLLGRAATADEIAAARKLFAQVIDAPGGLKIMTIHSFCQSVLGRFPLEAGLTPPFTALEDAAAAALRQRARDDVLAQARVPGTKLNALLNNLAAEVNEDAFAGLLQDIVRECRQMRELPGDLHIAVCGALGIDTYSEEELLKVLVSDNVINGDGLRRACRVMADNGTSKSDQPKSVSIQNFLDAPAEKRATLFNEYIEQFLTAKGEILKNIMTARTGAIASGHEDAALRAEAQRLLDVQDSRKAVVCARLTCDLMEFGAAIWQRYETLKRARAALDFDDLINKTLDLLERSDMAGWVMYKLDGGLDHILIDEAQDTNPEQWRIVKALTEDFFSGLGAKPDTARTIFTVGDQKQSIYGFQRAAPEKFYEMREYFAEITQAAKQKWRNEDMNFSFRSTPSVLGFVDEVFLAESVRKGLGLLERLSHDSQRPDDAGLVELWPLFTTPDKEDRTPWTTPDAPRDSRSGGARLAEHIGATVKGWIDNKEQLLSKGRNVAPGDILILVRRRTPFVNQMIRALKTRGVAVSGIDRMVLKEQLAVQDLLAAAQFALLPEDDLTLACLLKSPLIGWTDQQLENIAPKRTGSLWDAVRDADSDIVAWLQKQISHAASDHPYEFFARLLQTPCPADKISGLHAMTARLGAEALDPLDEFLNIALTFETGNIAALQGFLVAMEQGDSEIKREQEEAGGAVRIMTVHGAKGLEAPIVILPDTVRATRTSGGSQRLIWPDKSNLKVPLWSPRADRDCRFYKTLLGRLEDRQDEEYRRLLYVALTRARDRLYICGHTGRKPPLPENWYNYAAQAFERIADAESQPFESKFFLKPEGEDTPQLRRISAILQSSRPPGNAPAAQDNREPPLKPADLPRLSAPPQDEPDPPRPLAPSRPAEAEPAAPSPLAQSDTYRFRRGTVTHKLLQLLPDLPALERKAAAQTFTNRYAADLPEPVQAMAS